MAPFGVKGGTNNSLNIARRERLQSHLWFEVDGNSLNKVRRGRLWGPLSWSDGNRDNL
jgi:hypothetical protein